MALAAEQDPQLLQSEARETAVAALARQKLSTGSASSISAGLPKGRGSAFPSMSVAGQVANLFATYAELAYALPFEVLTYIELLSAWNPDFSQAVDNIRTLANSGHNLFVDDSRPRMATQVNAKLDAKSMEIRQRSGGVDGLIDQLLDQAAVYGAMCGEWVLNEDLTDVVDFTVVNPKEIRFFWDEDVQDWAPYQIVNAMQQAEARERGQRVRNGCVELNTNTFHYFDFDAAPGSPYGTPPFLAALPNIAVQRDMVNNLAQIVKKVGLIGMIDMTVQSLQARPGETSDQFIARATQFLDNYTNVVQDMVRDGGVVHFDDVEVTTTNLAGNAAGATNIFKQNEELIFSGLKSMPSVQGRSYSTTETYAGVAYDIIIRNTYKYQRSVKRMIELGYWLMVTVWGDTPTGIRLEFKSNKSLHRLQDAQAFRLEIFNAVLMWAMGLINQIDVAQMLGQQEPKAVYATPPDSQLLGPLPTVGVSAKGPEGGAEDAPAAAKMAKIEKLVGALADAISEMEE